ncbi:MAG: glycosyltransferase family 39 protein [Gemmatimonadetes bacterium]|nr:glycosyltransferase family 39 protein [Gemmatimonadota bacterium]
MTSNDGNTTAGPRAPSPTGSARAVAPPRRGGPWVPGFLALLAVMTVLIALTFDDYGITFDEPVHAVYGEHILAWYRSAFQDRDVFDYRNMEFYGGLFDVFAQAAWRFSPFGQYETRHLVNALFGIAGLVAVWRIAGLLAGPRAAFLAAAFLALTPVWYGHAFNNPKDVPFAVLFLVSLYFILEWIRALPRVPWRRVVMLGGAIGLAMAVRMAGILLFGYLGAAWLAWYVWRRRAGDPPGGALAAFALRGGAAFALAWAVMLPWWPNALVRPITHPIRTLRELSNFDWNYNVFFDGRQIPATELPWAYLPKWVLLTLPEFVLLGVLAAAGFAVYALARRRAPATGPDTTAASDARGVLVIQWGTLVLAFGFPAAFAILTGAVLYDGLRHFLFAVPLLAIIAAAGVDRLLASGRIVRALTAAAVAGLMGLTLSDMIRLHPHQYVWFNRLVAGGVEKAARSYETDYWGNAYKEAVEWLDARYGATPADRPIRVASCSQRLATEYYMRPEIFRYVGPNGDPELFLGAPRFRCMDRIGGRVVHEVGRMGATFVVIKEVGWVTAPR